MATDTTKSAIFEAAENLYADRSFADVQLRDIAAEAGVALAAINYHFGSKDELIAQLFSKRMSVMNRERLDLLQRAEASNGGRAGLKEILDAFVGPPLRWCFGADVQRSAGSRFVVRALVESVPAIRHISANELNHLEIFAASLRRALPRLSAADLYWGLHFTIAMVRQTINDHATLSQMSHKACSVDDLDDIIERIVEIAAVAFSRKASKPKIIGKIRQRQER